jgi:hypothetical protein
MCHFKYAAVLARIWYAKEASFVLWRNLLLGFLVRAQRLPNLKAGFDHFF